MGQGNNEETQSIKEECSFVVVYAKGDFEESSSTTSTTSSSFLTEHSTHDPDAVVVEVVWSEQDRDVLLDHFPFTNVELDILLPLEQQQQQQEQSLDNRSHNLPPLLMALWNWAIQNVYIMESLESSKLGSTARFLEAVASLLGRRSETFLYRALFHVPAQDNGTLPITEAARLFFQLIQLDCHFKDPHFLLLSTQDEELPPLSWIASLRQMATGEGGGDTLNGLTWSTWNLWIRECAPWLHTIVPSLFHSFWFRGDFSNFRPGLPWTLPEFIVPKGSDMAFSSHSLELVAPLTTMLGPSQQLFAIYSSCQQGLALATLQQALLGYSGSTLLIFGTTHDQILGYFTQAPWKCGLGWHGAFIPGLEEISNDAFLFTLLPTWQMFARTFDDASQQQQQQIQGLDKNGLVVGGCHVELPRLHITPNLEQCRAMPTDRTFRSGSLLDSNDCVLFDVDWIQVYAVAKSDAEFQLGQKAGKVLLNQREWNRQKILHVDKSCFLEDFANGLLENRLYLHRQQARGRATFGNTKSRSLGDDEEEEE